MSNKDHKKKTKVYLAGPMSGYDAYNFPAFHEYADMLRKQGFHVFSPAEADLINFSGLEDVEEQYENNPKETYKKCLRVDFNYIMDHADAIALLPGWEKSKGANAELALAKALGLEVILLDNDGEQQEEQYATVADDSNYDNFYSGA